MSADFTPLRHCRERSALPPPPAKAMRATPIARMRATFTALVGNKGDDIYRLNPNGPKPKRIMGIVYNSQARQPGA